MVTLTKKNSVAELGDERKCGRDILRYEWHLCLFFSIVAFFIASLLMTGWPLGILPDVRYPYLYKGEGVAVLALIQRMMEGAWIFFNNRIGFPFGGNSLDFPIPDTGSLFILKTLGRLLGSSQAAMNLFFLISFPVTFVCSYVFLRIVGLCRSFATAAGFLFVFLPFHFQRIVHLFYTWYFVIPIYFYFGFYLFCGRKLCSQRVKFSFKTLGNAVVLLILTLFGVYYSFFGCLILFVSAVAGAIANKSRRCLILGFVAIAIIFLGVLANVTPFLLHRFAAGDNVEAVQRTVGESEIYGLKLVQMLLPHSEHRVGCLNKITKNYRIGFPLVNENEMAALGVFGAIGFLSLLCLAFVSICGVPVDSRLAFFSITSICLFFLATIGGGASLFAMVVSPLLRGWNRVSVFIGFGAIASLFLIIQLSLNRFFEEKQVKKMILPIAIGLCALGLWDQTRPAPILANDLIRKSFESDSSFIKSIEMMVPPNSAIYQLPYMASPEVPDMNQLNSFDLFIGFLHSKQLHWSYGGIKGRVGDLFFRALAQQPMRKQVEVITRLGFAGIYIDRRGFADHGRGLEEQLREIFGEGSQLQSVDGNLAFIKLPHLEKPLAEGVSPQEVMRRAGFWVDFNGKRYPASLAEGIDFRQKSFPAYVKEVKGMSDAEPWGCWSDADRGESVEIIFFKPLPPVFILKLRARAFGPNAGATVKVQVGDFVENVILQEGFEEKQVSVATKKLASKIKISPPFPQSPLALGMNYDRRRLGIGLERIRIEEP
ncbi:MAG TPA: sugar translocase [Candidatus Omnitrophota bacterium]|nr:sugar translocase [Candidatus Omnitrophota bacterium]